MSLEFRCAAKTDFKNAKLNFLSSSAVLKEQMTDSQNKYLYNFEEEKHPNIINK